MKKLLLVGFHKYDDYMYPHLRCFIDKVSEREELSYFHYRERGYFMEGMMGSPFNVRCYIKSVLAICISIYDAAKLYFCGRKYENIVAIDHYAYAICSSIFTKKNVVFWSHDIISRDFIIYDSIFVKAFMKVCASSLKKRKKLIIQSEERLTLLLDSLNLMAYDHDIEVFFMPTFLGGYDVRIRELSSRSRPRLMQCGAIGRFRFSDDLLSHYQRNESTYRLYLHGFFMKEMLTALRSCDVQPMVSSRILKPEHLVKIVDYCDVGFVGYRQQDSNFKVIAKASGQLAEFLRVGVPVIVLGENDLKDYVEKNGIGIGLKDINELSESIAKIACEYEKYSESCFAHYEDVYNYKLYVENVVEFIHK